MIFKVYALNNYWEHVTFVRLVSRGKNKGKAIVTNSRGRKCTLPVSNLYCHSGCGRRMQEGDIVKGKNGQWIVST